MAVTVFPGRFKSFDRRLNRRLDKLIRRHGVVGEYEVNVYLVGEKHMRRLHRRWLRRSSSGAELHDVLSFPLDRDTSYPDGIARLGDIVICVPYTQRLKEDVADLAEHGCLHLLGVHHD